MSWADDMDKDPRSPSRVAEAEEDIRAALPPGVYTVAINVDLLMKLAEGRVPFARLVVRDGELVDFKPE